MEVLVCAGMLAYVTGMLMLVNYMYYKWNKDFPGQEARIDILSFLS